MTLEEFARAAIAVPFADHGRGWNGWDCWGLVRLAYREVLEVDLPAWSEGYDDAGETPAGRDQVARLIAAGRVGWIRTAPPGPGDVLLLNLRGRPLHVALALWHGRFLHTESRTGTVIERLAAPLWARRLEGSYRLAR